MNLTQYQIDAFATRPFEGNPAAVVPLDTWIDDALMQSIANENNLSETAFFVPEGDGFALRWFTPEAEVNLCGHATLATAHVLFEHMNYAHPSIRFSTRSGDLRVERRGDRLAMDFPAQPTQPCDCPEALVKGLGIMPVAVEKRVDYLAVLESESTGSRPAAGFERTEKTRLPRHHGYRTGGQQGFRQPFLCPDRGHRGRSGDRISALPTGPLLGQTVGQE